MGRLAMWSKLDLSHLVTAMVLIAVFAMAVRVPADPDTWWHLRCGQVQWHTFSVIQVDPFSHTASGTPWINQSWLPQLAMYGLFVLGGFPALALAVAALVAATMAWVMGTAQVEGRYGYLGRAFVILWAAIATGRVWTSRPHLLSFLLISVWVYLLDRSRHANQPRLLWWLPPLMLLWANSHGGYIVGFLLLGAEIGGTIFDRLRGGQSDQAWRAIRLQAIVTLVCLLAVLINPQGFRLLLFPFQTLGSFAQQTYVAEWASPDFHAGDMLPFLGLLLATWSALVWSRRTVTGTEWLRLLGFTAMALRSGRYLGLCAVVAASLLVRHGASAVASLVSHAPSIPPAKPARGLPALNWALLALLLVAAGIKVSQPVSPEVIAQVHGQIYPVAAVDYMRTHPQPPTLFNEYAWGGYLIWALYPDARVFIDGRADPYGDALIAAYRNTISALPGWEQTLQEYQVQTVLIPVNSPLASALSQCESWKTVYSDHVAIIFVRRTAP